MKLFLHLAVVLFDATCFTTVTAWTTTTATTTATTTTVQYFAVGSNVAPSTMTCLRNLHPIHASAAVLPRYRLAFNVPGNPLVEPSAAAAVRDGAHCIHGALYELTRQEFRQLSRSEGVPFAYQWEKCQVYPYQGDNETAGATAMEQKQQQQQQQQPIDAYVLVAQPLLFAASNKHKNNFIPPSPSYLRIIQQGAAYWKLDASYQEFLASVETSQNLLLPDGLAGRLLETAEFLNPRRATWSPKR